MARDVLIDSLEKLGTSIDVEEDSFYGHRGRPRC
jgi:hypothetical protein